MKQWGVMMAKGVLMIAVLVGSAYGGARLMTKLKEARAATVAATDSTTRSERRSPAPRTAPVRTPPVPNKATNVVPPPSRESAGDVARRSVRTAARVAPAFDVRLERDSMRAAFE